MKKHLKRVLSMILAVLMVMGTLPMNVFALEMLDGADSMGQAEVPVLDNDGPAGLRGDVSFTGEEQPEIPVTPQPSEDPGELTWTNGTVSATINSDGSWTVTMSTNDAEENTTSGDWGVALIPNAKRGDTTVLPSEIVSAADFNGSTVGVADDVRTAITGGAGLLVSEFICVGGADLRTDASGNFTVSSADYGNMPNLDTLVEDLGVTSPVDVVVVFFTKGSGAEQADGGVGTHVKYTTAKYGTAAAGIPSTIYALNKGSNKLTYISGKLGGQDWPTDGEIPGLAPGAEVTGGNGSWTSGNSRLQVPVYNRTSGAVTIDTSKYTGISGVTFSGVDSNNIDGNGTTMATFSIGSSVTSGTIVLPIEAVDANGDPMPSASITIIIGDNIPVTADAIEFDVDVGEEIFTAQSKPVTFHWPATWPAIVPEYNDDGEETGNMVSITLGDEGDYYIDVYDDTDEEGNNLNTWSGMYGGADYGAVFDYTPENDENLGPVVCINSTPIAVKLPAYNAAFDEPGPLSTVATIVGAMERDYGVETTDIEVPITINVHAGYARFMPATGSPINRYGQPNGPVSAAKNGGIPDGKWTKNSDGSGDPLSDADILLGARDKTEVYYAVKDTTYTVKFDTNVDGRTLTPNPSSLSDVENQAAGTTIDPMPTLTDDEGRYTFEGWARTKKGSVEFDSTNKYKVNADDADASNVITLYAVWEELKYDVTYANSATSGEPQFTATELSGLAGQYMKGDTVTVDATLITAGDEKQGTNNLYYTFKEWKAPSDVTVASGGTFTMPGKDVALTATWDAVMLDVTYVYGTTIDGKTSETASGAVQKGDDYAVAKNAPGTWTGHTFTGWKLTAGTGTAASEAMHQGDQVTGVTTAITLTAQWTLDGYAITYDWGDVTPYDHSKDPAVAMTEPGPGSADHGTDYALEATTGGVYLDADKKAWTLTGWKVGDSNADNTGAVLTNDGTTAGEVKNVVGPVTLTAQWTEKKYNVTYQWDSKGALTTSGDDPTALTLPDGNPFAVQQGTEHTVSTDIQVNTTTMYLDSNNYGWNFAGWVITAPTGDGAPTIDENGKFIMPGENVVLTASWTAVNHTVTFDPDGGSPTPAAQTVQHGKGASTPTQPTKEHYVFQKWVSDGTDFSTSTPVVDDITYTAVWEKEKYTVTFHPNGTGATLNGDTKNVVVANVPYDTTIADDPTPEWTGHDFVKWTTDQAGTTEYTPGTTKIEGNTNVYAQWKASEYTVTYEWGDIKGGEPIKVSGGAETLPTESNKVEYGKNYTVKSAPDTSTVYLDEDNLGWTLSGWKVTRGTGDSATTDANPVNPGGSVTNVTSDIKLVAQWTEKKYVVTFYANGGDFTDAPSGDTLAADKKTVTRQVQHGAQVGAAPTDLEWTNNHFIKYTVNANGTGGDFAATDVITEAKNYHAQWEGDKGSVTVTVTKDGEPYTGLTVTLKDMAGVTFTEGTTDETKGVYTATGVAVDTYDVLVDGRGTEQSVTVTKDQNATAAVKYWTVGVSTDTHGSAKVAANDKTALVASASSDATSSGAEETIVVLDGTSVTWSYVSANTDYKEKSWADLTDDYSAQTATITAKDAKKQATFVKKTGKIVVKANLDDLGTAHNFPDGTVVTIVPHGVALGDATETQKKTQTVDADAADKTSVTFDNLAHDSTTGWDVYVGSTRIDDGSDVKVQGDDSVIVPVNAMYYTVTVKTDGHGDAIVTATDDGTNTASTDYDLTPTAKKEASIVVLEQAGVTWTDGDAELDYAFQNWDKDTTSTSDITEIIEAKGKVHTAYFSKVSFTLKAVVKLNDEAQTKTGDDITAIKAVRVGDGKDPESKAFTYDENEKKWVVSGLPSENTYKVVVTTLTGDFDISEGIKGTDTDTIEGEFFSVVTAAKSDYESAQATMDVETPAATGQPKVVVKKSTPITVTVTPETGYEHAGWVTDNDTDNTTDTVAANGKFTPTNVVTAGTGITLKPTFTYIATIKPTRTEGETTTTFDADTVVVKDADGNEAGTPAKDDTTHVWTVKGLTIDETYTIWVNGYESDKTTSGIGEVEVPMWKLSTTDSPENAAKTKTVKGETAIYMPNGAGEANMALAEAANDGYRLRTATETPATWTSSDTTIAAVTLADTGNTVTVTNITKDVTLTVNLVKQWTVDVVNTNKDAGTLDEPIVSVGGTVATVDNTDSYKGNLVDDQGTIQVGVTPVPGYTPTWTATDSEGNTIEGLTLPGTVTVEQDMTITVTWEATKYDVEVKINLNNEAKKVINPETGDPILYLVEKNDASTKIALKPKTDGSDGVYTANVVPGEYTIWSPVASADENTAQNTGRVIKFDIQDGEKANGVAGATGSADKLKETLNYYTVTVNKQFSDDPDDGSFTAPGNVFAGHGDSAPTSETAETAAAARTVLAGKGDAKVQWNISATVNNHTAANGPYYKFGEWQENGTKLANPGYSGTYTMGGENTWTENDDVTGKGITLTAVYAREYKVTLGAPDKAGSAAAPTKAVTAPLNDQPKRSDQSNNNSLYVDQTKPDVKVGAPTLTDATEEDNHIFSAWKADDGTGSFNEGQTVFTVTGDTTLTPLYYKKPTLSGRQSHHLNFPVDHVFTGSEKPSGFGGNANNSEPVYTWTANDAAIGDVKLTFPDNSEVTLTKGTDYTYDADTGEITIKRSYLEGLGGDRNGTGYTVTVESKTPTGGTDTNCEAGLAIYVTPDQLTEVKIKVKANQPATTTPYDTLNLTEGAKEGAADRKTAIYASHKADTIIKENVLEFTWYFGDTATTGTDVYTDAGSYLAEDRAKDYVKDHYDGDLLDGDTQAALTTLFTGGTAPNANLSDVNLKGKYIYAVVKASVTGYGAVITNAIPVDYDAAIKVRKDGDPIDAADKGHYKVYLVKAGETPTTASGALTEVPGVVVATTYDEATGTYQTDPSTLTGGVTYSVYVNKVENDFEVFVDTKVSVTTQVNAADTTKVVDFYSVNQVDTTRKNATDSAGDEVPEHFDALPGLKFYAADVTNDFASGMGVLTGTAVTATTDATWTQDYDANWGKKASATQPDLSTEYGTQNQPTADAAARAKGYSAGQITAKTWIGAQLDQNTYTVTGNVWVIGGGAGGVKIGADAPTLTSGGHVFTPRAAGLTGDHRNTVTFTVPRSSSGTGSAITEQYVLKAKEKDGSTIIKFIPGENLNGVADTETFDSKTALADDKLAAITEGFTNADNPTFTIVVEAAKFELHVDEVGEADNKHAEHDLAYNDTKTDPGVASSAGQIAQRDWRQDYADFEDTTYTITVSNQGNIRLKVALNLKKSVADNADAANNGYVYGDEAKPDDAVTDLNGMTDDFNNVVFTGLEKGFILEPKGAADDADSKTFTVTIPKGLAVKLAANYDFEFTSIQAGTDAEGATLVYGPSVTYKLTQTVDPLKITNIAAKLKADKTYEPDTDVLTLTDKDGNNIVGASAITAKGIELGSGEGKTPEVVYSWWKGPYGAKREDVEKAFDAANGGFTDSRYSAAAGDNGDGTYTEDEADQGMAIYIVAKHNGTGNVTHAAFDYPSSVAVPYALQIKVNENTNPAADKDNYNLYLWPTQKKGADGNLTANDPFATNGPGVIHATPGTASTTDGLYDVAGLVPGLTYKVYSNAVGGGSNADWKDSTVTVSLNDFGTKADGSAKDPKVVTYHDVKLNNTLVDNKHYTITSNDAPFYKTVDGTTVTAIGINGLNAPTAKYGASTDVATSATSADRWVQEGADINLSYEKWERDYTFAWTAGATEATNNKDAGATATAKVNDSTTVETKLTLNLYDLQVYVMGNGSVSKIMLDGGASGKYTSAAPAAGFVTGTVNATSGAASATNSVGAGSSVIFRVPAGTYEVSADKPSGVDLVGYREPHDETNTVATVDNLSVAVPAKKNLDVVVNTSGRAMSVSDNADEQVTGATKASDTAIYESTTDKNSPEINQTITLPYGYDKVDLTLTVANVGASNTDTLFDVIMNADDVDADDTGKITVTGPAEDAIKLDGTADLHMVDGTGEKTAVTLSIDKGLSRDSYHSTLVFTFSGVEGTTDDAEKASVTYNLTVEVVPTEFKKVTVVGDKNTPATDMLPLGEGLKFDTFETEELNDWDNATGAPKTLTTDDYTYQWYYGTEASPTVTWSDTGDNAAVTVPGDMHAIDGQTAATLSADEIAKHPGQNFYLVISAVKGRNVISAAISDPVPTGFQPVVKIVVDGVTKVHTVDSFDGTGYVVKLTNADGSASYNTVWSDAKDGFVPVSPDDDTTPISLPGGAAEYTVYAAKYEGQDPTLTTDMVKQTTKLSEANDTVRVPYFTVNTVATKAVEAISGLGEDFADDGSGKMVVGPTPTLNFGGVDIDSGTAVLSGQSVNAKFPATAADSGVAWTQDYTLTWQQEAKSDNTSDGNNLADVAGATETAVTALNDQAFANITAKTYIGGRLDQNTYTIVSTVSSTSATASVKEVKGDQMDDGETSRQSYSFAGRASSNGLVTSSVSNTATTLRNGHTVTFKVVKGKFDIAATPSDDTVITSIKWEETGDTVNDGDPLEGKEVAATGDSKIYNVTITVVDSNVKFSVSDGTYTGESQYGDGTNEVVRYFSHIGQQKANAANPDTKEYTLTLTNPGNKDLTMSLDVFHYADAASVPDYTKPALFLDADKVYSAEKPAANKAQLKPDGRVVLTLGDDAVSMMTAGDKLEKKNDTTNTDGTLTAGKVILGENAWAKDSGVYVFRFKGETGVEDETKYAYYVLDLTVKQLPIKTVATNSDGSMVGKDDVISVKGFSADPETTPDTSLANVEVAVDDVGTKKPASTVNLTDADVKFAWVKVAAGATKPADTEFTVAADGTLTSAIYTDISQGASYTVTATDVDHDFYLVAYAPNNDDTVTNACELAISDVVKAKRTAGVKVYLDTAWQPVSAPYADPGYTVYLLDSTETFDPDDLSNMVTTTWNAATRRYEAPIDEGKTYGVYALAYKGDGAPVVKAIDDTLGKQADDSVETERIVNYWSVKHTANVAVENKYDGFKSYLPSGTATNANALQGALSVQVSDDRNSTNYTKTLTDASVPVLEGMNVKVTVDTTQKNNNATKAEAWSEKADYHTLTTDKWTDAATNKTSGIAYPTGTDQVVSADMKVEAGIQDKTFSAKLEQVLFTVKFTVKDVTDPGPSSNTAIGKVTLSPDKTNEPNATDSISVSGREWKHNDEVTIDNVPAGDLRVKAEVPSGISAIVKSYAWDGTEGDLVTVTTNTAINEDTEGGDKDNLINIVEAAKAVTWLDDFDYTDGGNLEEITNDQTLRKVDLGGADPDLSLTAGYNATDDTLTYRVKVTNTGNEPLNNFYISQLNEDNWTAELKQATYHDKDGNETVRAVDSYDTSFTLDINEYVTFTISIPVGQVASAANYSSRFRVEFTPTKENEQLAGQDYTPQYQVKGDVKVDKDGTAEIFYGDIEFSGANDTQITVSGGFTGQRFHYAIMSEAEVADYLGDGVTPEDIVRYDLPGWLDMDEDTGEFSVTGSAEGVHVKEDPADSELKVYVKITSADDSRLVRYATFTLNVKTTQLSIFTAITTDGSWSQDPAKKTEEGAAYRTDYVGAYGTGGTAPDPTKVEGSSSSGKIIHGGTVEKDFFSYTEVTSIWNSNDKVVTNGTHNAGETVAMGTWSVTPTSFDGSGDNEENAKEYTFKFTYTGTGETDKYDYVGHEIVLAIPVQKPPLSLEFADAIANATKVVGGTTYTKQDGEDMTGDGNVPVKLDYTTATKRLGEQITYLDTKPTYTVKLRKIGELEKVTLAVVSVDGFDVTDVAGEPTFDEETGVYSFEVTVDHMKTDPKLWKGDHTLTLKAEGYQQAGDAEAAVEATYELTLKVLPRPITKADVTELDTPKLDDPKLDDQVKVKPTLEGDTDPDNPLLKPDGTDENGITPVTPKVEWEPKKEPVTPDDYTVTITLEPDQNYVFVEEVTPDPDDPTKEPNYTLDDKGDKDWPEDKGDPELTVTKDPDGTDVVYTKTFPVVLPGQLKFDDVNVDNAQDKKDPAVTVERTIEVVRGEGLGAYTISLGAYDNTVTTVTVTEAKDLPEGAVWSLTPDAFEHLDDATTTPANRKSYTLNLKDVDTAALPKDKDTYTLVLTANGTGHDGQAVPTATYKLTIKVLPAPTPVLKFDDVNQDNSNDRKEPNVTVERTINIRVKGTLGKYTIDLGSYGGTTNQVKIFDVTSDIPSESILKLGERCKQTTLEPLTLTDREKDGELWSFTELDLSDVDTSKAGKYTLTMTAEGVDINGEKVGPATYKLTINITSGSSGGGDVTPSCPHQVSFLLGLYGTTTDPVMDMVADKAKISKEPAVTAVEGWKFLGWSMTAPTGKADQDAKRELVVPKDVSITADTNFYAVYAPAYDLGRPFHEHYVIGYPNGNFGPADNINRASVATIIARAVLPNFVEGADYGNPGGYSDVNGHWAASAIAYCSKYGVFNGYEDGTFRPDQSITRQEFALVMARLDGVLTAGSMPFSDISEAGDWALGGIYTAYIKGWVNGYTDGTFKPLDYIRRDEAVKVFNAYLYRGVDAEGLSDLKEYVHSGVASNNQENGTTEYMTWPDVPKDHWAYYEIIEAANDHEYTVDTTLPKGYTVPEHWDKCWIDEKWRYHDDLNDGGPTVGLVTAGFRIWTEA